MRGKGGCPLKVTLTSLAPTLTLGPERLAGTARPIVRICGRYSDLALTYSYLPEPEVRPQRTIRAVRHQEMTVLLEPACTCEEGATATDHATSTAVWTFPAGDVLLRASRDSAAALSMLSTRAGGGGPRAARSRSSSAGRVVRASALPATLRPPQVLRPWQRALANVERLRESREGSIPSRSHHAWQNHNTHGISHRIIVQYIAFC